MTRAKSTGPRPGTGILVAVLGLAPVLLAQTSRPTASNPSYAGWLAENLDRDFGAARDLYAKAGADENLGLEHRLLALVRLGELQLVRGRSEELQGIARQVRALLRGRITLDRAQERAWETLQLGREFAAALALSDPARTDELARLRAELHRQVEGFDAGRNLPEPRPWFHRVLVGMATVTTGGETRGAGDRARAPTQLTEFSPVLRRRAAFFARLRLDGHSQQAERLTEAIRRGRPVGRLGQGEPSEVLARAIRKLQDSLGERIDLIASERSTLERLRDRLLLCQQKQEWTDGVELLRSLPIYDVWLLGN